MSQIVQVHNADDNESNHISALVKPAVEVREVEGEEGNDVSERSSLQQKYDGDGDGDGDGEIRCSPAGWLDQDS